MTKDKNQKRTFEGEGAFGDVVEGSLANGGVDSSMRARPVEDKCVFRIHLDNDDGVTL